MQITMNSKSYKEKCEVVLKSEAYESSKDILASIRYKPTEKEKREYAAVRFCAAAPSMKRQG